MVETLTNLLSISLSKAVCSRTSSPVASAGWGFFKPVVLSAPSFADPCQQLSARRET